MYQLLFLPSVCECFSFSTYLSTLGIVRLFNFRHYGGCIVGSYCGFSFLWWLMVLCLSNILGVTLFFNLRSFCSSLLPILKLVCLFLKTNMNPNIFPTYMYSKYHLLFCGLPCDSIWWIRDLALSVIQVVNLFLYGYCFCDCWRNVCLPSDREVIFPFWFVETLLFWLLSVGKRSTWGWFFAYDMKKRPIFILFSICISS